MSDLKPLPGFSAADCAKILLGVEGIRDDLSEQYDYSACIDCDCVPCVRADIPDFDDPRDSPENTRGGL